MTINLHNLTDTTASMTDAGRQFVPSTVKDRPVAVVAGEGHGSRNQSTDERSDDPAVCPPALFFSAPMETTFAPDRLKVCP